MTDVIPACSASQTFSPSDFPTCTWTATRNFKLLGAATRDMQWCESLLCKRVAKASTLIRAIGRYRVPHGAFTVLRSCARWAQILNSCRTVPPSFQSGALAQADFETRGALDRLVGSPLSDGDLGISCRGIGARSAQEDAPAACRPSPSATAKLSRRIWPPFDEYDLDSGCLRSNAEFELRYCVPGGADFADEFVSSSQKALSSMIEARAFSEVQRKAHLVLNLHPQLFGHKFAFLQANGAVSHGHLARGLHLSTMWTDAGPIRRPCPLPGFTEAIGFAVAMLYETLFIASPVMLLSRTGQEKLGLLPP